MEKKKSTVLKRKVYGDKDQYGNTSFIIEFENKDNGFWRSKTESPTMFTEGIEYEYTIEEKEGKNGKKYFQIKPIATENNFGFNKKPYDPAADNFRQALIVAQSSLTKSVELLIAGKIDDKQIQTMTDRLMQIQFDLAKKYQSEVNKPIAI